MQGKFVAPVFLFAVLSAGWWLDIKTVESVPLCAIKFLSGIDCPGCGLTRSFLSMARLEVVSAFRYNASGPLLYLVFLVSFLESVVGLVRKDLRLSWPSWIVGLFGFILMGLLLGHWLYRIRGHFVEID